MDYYQYNEVSVIHTIYLDLLFPIVATTQKLAKNKPLETIGYAINVP